MPLWLLSTPSITGSVKKLRGMGQCKPNSSVSAGLMTAVPTSFTIGSTTPSAKEARTVQDLNLSGYLLDFLNPTFITL